MTKYLIGLLSIVNLCLAMPRLMSAQVPEGESDRYIRVAEVGQLADSINVWGDVGSSGRYIIPEGTKLPDLISFSFGYSRMMGRENNIDWTKTLFEVKVTRYNKNNKLVNAAFFRYKYHDTEPVEMFEFELENNDIVTLQVKRTPSFTDYVGVVAPVIGVVATSVLLIQNLRGN